MKTLLKKGEGESATEIILVVISWIILFSIIFWWLLYWKNVVSPEREKQAEINYTEKQITQLQQYTSYKETGKDCISFENMKKIINPTYYWSWKWTIRWIAVDLLYITSQWKRYEYPYHYIYKNTIQDANTFNPTRVVFASYSDIENSLIEGWYVCKK